MASFPALPSIHILPEATCNTHLFSDDGSPDQACVMSHQSYSGVAAAPAPAELCGASDALAAQPGTDRAALKHYSPLNTGIDEDGEAGQGDSDSPSAGSEEPGRRRHPRGRGMAGEAQVGLGMWDLCRLYTHRPGSTSAWAGSGTVQRSTNWSAARAERAVSPDDELVAGSAGVRCEPTKTPCRLLDTVSFQWLSEFQSCTAAHLSACLGQPSPACCRP